MFDKAAFLQAIKPKTTDVDVEGFGPVKLKQLSVAEVEAERAKLKEDKNDDVVANSVDTYGIICVAQKLEFPQFYLDCCLDKRQEVRDSALNWGGEFWLKVPGVANFAIDKMMKSQHSSVRKSGVMILAELKKNDNNTMEAIERAKSDSTFSVRYHANLAEFRIRLLKTWMMRCRSPSNATGSFGKVTASVRLCCSTRS